ncbi:hypothetical protein GCM10022384_03020 [Streptomyces marokkonensis]|uniref:Uncharacterized protein n=1 Tax=Streptomyces marokkonensis TaxID=324855 RepID=A0ABP7NSR8_9ACTN
MIAQPEDGPVPYTDRADIAEATAVVLAGDRSLFAEADPLLAELLGREPRTAADRLAAHVAA